MAYSQSTHTFKTEEAAGKAVQAAWAAHLFARWTPDTKQIAVMGGEKEVKAWKDEAEKIEPGVETPEDPENTGGENTGGENTGGENTGGENTGGENTGGENTGGENTGGAAS